MDTPQLTLGPARESTADNLHAVIDALQKLKPAIDYPAEFRAFAQSHGVEPEIVECFLDFWWPLLEKDGRLDLAQIMRELYDYRTALREVGKAYVHLTNGKFSKPNTDAEYIIAAVEDNYSDTSE